MLGIVSFNETIISELEEQRIAWLVLSLFYCNGACLQRTYNSAYEFLSEFVHDGDDPIQGLRLDIVQDFDWGHDESDMALDKGYKHFLSLISERLHHIKYCNLAAVHFNRHAT